MKCWNCGKTAIRTRKQYYDGEYIEMKPSNYHRSYCAHCLEELYKQEEEEHNLYIKLKKREMFRKAVDTLEKQETDMYDYKPAIDVVEKYVDANPDKIDSSYEVLAAIILVHNRYYSQMQYKVGKYQVDFLLPELLVVLEIDGERHKANAKRDRKRDAEIRAQLGEHWEIIRIDTDMLDKDAKKLPNAIEAVLKYREANHVNWRELYL